MMTQLPFNKKLHPYVLGAITVQIWVVHVHTIVYLTKITSIACVTQRILGVSFVVYVRHVQHFCRLGIIMCNEHFRSVIFKTLSRLNCFLLHARFMAVVLTFLHNYIFLYSHILSMFP